MFTINDEYYSKANVDQQLKSYASLAIIHQHQAIAVCVEDTFMWLTLCYYMKAKQVSVMPIHPKTPFDTAHLMATKAGCSLLIYKNINQYTELTPANTLKTTTLQTTDNSRAGIIQMSSGTTGDPKQILRSWQDIDIEIASYCEAFTAAQTMTPVVACPITHSYGLICGVMVAIQREQNPIIITTINPKYIIKKLQSVERPLLYSSPVMLQGLLRLWPENSQLFAAITSGSTMSNQTFEQINAKVEKLYQQYGCSETGCVSISQALQTANDIGKPLPHVHISCSNDQQAPSEIIVAVETANGTKTLGTQDLGFFNEDNSLCFVARLDDTIIVSGLNVYPVEIEDIILSHPQISDVVIFKIEDKFAGHRVCLQYVSLEVIAPAELRLWCTQHLAPFQVPQVLQQVEHIGRLANSKVNRKQIAKDYEQSITSVM